MNTNLDIVIINYFSTEKIKALFQSIEKSDLNDIYLYIIVISNSNEPEIYRLEKENSAVDVIINRENEGFARACNKAIPYCKGDYLLLLNPDTLLFEDTLQKSVSFMQTRQDITVLGSKHINASGEIAPACFYFPTLQTYLYDIIGLSKIAPSKFRGLLFPAYTNDSGFPDHVMGAFMMIRKSFIDQFGFMDEHYFLYAEDMDWCKKVWNKKGKIFYNAEITIIHEGGNSTEGTNTNRRICYALESKLKYAYKHFSSGKYYILLFATLFVEPVTRISFAFAKFSFGQAKDVLRIYFLFAKRRQFR